MSTYNFTGDVRFKELLIGVLEKNELNGISPYSLRWAGTSASGWSFGVVQYDLGQRGDTLARRTLAISINKMLLWGKWCIACSASKVV
ncbi:MAG: hypothetical protein JW914_05290, partial [Syntrophaceae bacterium]|nr:hypothetical protein [Syntrophaceae bacterium]